MNNPSGRENKESRAYVGGSDRGVSNVVAIILLLGIVIFGAATVFIIGGGLISDLQSGIGGEQVSQTMGSIDHELRSVADGGGNSLFPADGYDQLQVDEGATVYIAWTDEDAPDTTYLTTGIDWDTQVNESIGKVEATGGDTVLAHEGGGIWEETDTGVMMRSSPDVGLTDDGAFTLNLLKIDSDQAGTPQTMTEASDSSDTLENLRQTAQNATAEHFVLKIESEYADGWERHFEEEADKSPDAAVDRDGDTVFFYVEGLGGDGPNFVVPEENGLVDTSGNPLEKNGVANVVQGEDFYFDAEVKNTGIESGKVNASLIIEDDDGEIENRTITSREELAPGETRNVKEGTGSGGWSWDKNNPPNGNYRFDPGPGGNPQIIDLEPGQSYTYRIETNSSGDAQVQDGRFVYLDDSPTYVVDSVANTSGSGETVELSAVVQNLGSEDGDEKPITLEVRPVDGGNEITTQTNKSIDAVEGSQLSWEFNETAWGDSEYEFTVSTEDDPDGESGTFEIDSGDFIITEDRGIVGADLVDGGEQGQVITQSTPPTFEANITSEFGEEATQNVTLVIDPDADEENEYTADVYEDLTLEGGDTETVELTADTLTQGVYEYRIETETDELDEPGMFFVDDDGPKLTINDVDVDDPVRPGDPLSVDVTLENQGEDGNETVVLDHDGQLLDSEQVEEIDGGTEIATSLEWVSVDSSDGQEDVELAVQTPHDHSNATVELEPLLTVTDVDGTADRSVDLPSQSMAFDGSRDYIDTGATAGEFGVDGDAEKTVTAWVNPGDFNDGGVFDMGTTGSAGEDFALRTLDGQGEWRGQFWGGADIDFSHGGTDQWIHFAVSWDGEETTIYADGQAVASAENDLDTSDDQTFRIGVWNDDHFDGSLADVRLYDTDLSGDDAETLADGGDVEDDLVGHWPLEEIDQDSTPDESSNDNDGTVNGPALTDSHPDEEIVHTVTVDATLETVGGELEDDREVTLEGLDHVGGFDGEQIDSTTVSGDEAFDVEFGPWDVPHEDAITDRVTVRTEDDEADDVVVFERSGPECDKIGVDDYEGDGTSSDPYRIETVDQLQCVKTVADDGHSWELANNIDAHGTENWNDGDGFHPIGDGDDNTPFTGTFDGQQHVVEGLYIDRPEDRIVGLFGETHDTSGFDPGNSELRNLRVEDAEVYGQRETGVVAGRIGGTAVNLSADGYVEAQEQRVGLITGQGTGADLTNQLAARGEVVGGDASGTSRGIGAVVGRTSWNTEVDTVYSVADVSGDANVGGLMGSSSSNPSEFENMYAANDVTADQGAAGAVTGLIEDTQDPHDRFRESVYWDEEVKSDPYGSNEERSGNEVLDWQDRTTDQMHGPSVLPTPEQLEAEGKNPDEFYAQYPGVSAEDADGTMAELDWEIWEPVYDIDPETGEITNEGYPQFAWEAEAEGIFIVEITNEDTLTDGATAGQSVTVEVDVRSTYRDGQETTQTISLVDPDGNVVDTKSEPINGTSSENEASIELDWQTDLDDVGEGDLIVRSEDTADSATVEVDEPDRETGESDGPTPGEIGEDALDTGSVGLDTTTGNTLQSDPETVSVDFDIIDIGF